MRSSTSILVTWEPPETMNGNLRHYAVTYGTERSNLNERRNSPTAVSYELTGLDEFTVYYVQVFAETSVSGKLSEIVDAKTLEDGMASNFECFVMLCLLTLHSSSNLGRQHTNAPPAATIGPFVRLM